MKVIITGSTGMIGGIVLDTCLASDQIDAVTSITRRPSGRQHAKLTEVIHDDFEDYKGLEAHFTDVDVAYFCIGAYTTSVPNALFKKITVDFTKHFADTLKAHSPESRFVFLSGMGADNTEKSRVAFARFKGIAENHLKALNFSALQIFRPGYIYPVEARKEPNFVYRVYRWLYPLINRMAPSSSVTSVQLGEAMFQAGLYPTNKITLENKDILYLFESEN